jgi:hypothetical protein
MAVPELITVEMPASELPETVLVQFRERPAGDQRFTVTVEPALSREEKLAALRREIDLGLDDLGSDRMIDGQTIFAELKTRYPAL